MPNRILCWEHEGNRAIRDGDMKLVAEHGKPWELYDLANDRAEMKNLAAERPEVVRKWRSAYEEWAKRTNVLPWDDVQSTKGGPAAE
jgi:arylsulfatase